MNIAKLSQRWADITAGLIQPTNVATAIDTEEDDYNIVEEVDAEDAPDNEWWEEKEEYTEKEEENTIYVSSDDLADNTQVDNISNGAQIEIGVNNQLITCKYVSNVTDTLASLELLNDDNGILGIDSETQPKKNPAYPLLKDKVGLHPSASELRLIQIYSKVLNTVYVFDCNNDEVKKAVLKFISNQPAKRFVAHNADFELLHFSANALDLQLSLPKSIHCTHKQHRLLYDGSQSLNKYTGAPSSLESIVLNEFGVQLDKQFQKASAWIGAITESKLLYAAQDAIFTLLVYEIFSERLRHFRQTLKLPTQRNPFIDEYENNIESLPALAQASAHGLNISTQYYEDARKIQHESLQSKQIVLQNITIKEKTKADLPTKAITEYLNHHLPDSITKSSKCARTPTTDEISLKINNLKFILENLDDNKDVQVKTFVANLLNYRKLKHEISTQGLSYLNKHVINHKIHPTFKILGAKTGRMACVRPNLQNISPSKFTHNYRNYYVPSAGYRFIEFDFSMIEVVFFAYLSNNKKMIAVLESGADIHEYTAAVLTGVEVAHNFHPTKSISKADRKKLNAPPLACCMAPR